MTRALSAVRPVLWATAGILVAFLYDPVATPLVGDSRGQFYIAERAASGIPPHASSINAKNGLSFMMAGWTIRVGRAVAIPDVYAVRVYGILLLAASVALVWIVASGIAGTRGADLAALTLLAMPRYVAEALVGVQPKVPLVFFLLLTGFAVARGRWLTAGGTAAAAFLCWQPAAFALAAAPVAPLLEPGRRRDALRFAAGALVVLAVYESYYLAQGLLAEQWSQAYALPARYMSDHRPGLGPSLRRITYNALDGFRIASVTVPIAALWAVEYWRAALRGLWELLRTIAADAPLAYLQLSAVAFALFTLGENQGAPDLFVFIPFLAIGTGVILSGATGGRRPPRWARPAVIGLLAAGALLGPMMRGSRAAVGFALQDQRALARDVRNLAGDDDGVFALNCTHLLALERRQNWTRYGHIFRGVTEYLTDRYGSSFDALRREGRLPTLVLMDEGLADRKRRLPPRTLNELATRYERVPRPEFERQGIVVYRLRGEP